VDASESETGRNKSRFGFNIETGQRLRLSFDDLDSKETKISANKASDDVEKPFRCLEGN
jgi:hypothetical protein